LFGGGLKPTTEKKGKKGKVGGRGVTSFSKIRHV